MPSGPPPTPSHYIPAETLYRVSGVSRSNHPNWVEKELVEPSVDGFYRELDLIETTVLSELVRKMGFTDSLKAWSQVRPLLKQSLPRGRLDVVFDYVIGTAELVQDDPTLADVVRDGGHFYIVPL